MNFKGKLIALGALASACLSCVEINNEIGGNFIPEDSRYDIFSAEIPLDEIDRKSVV